MSFKSVFNAALRRGLAAADSAPRLRKVVIRPHAFGFKPGIDINRLGRLADELEAREFAAKHVESC